MKNFFAIAALLAIAYTLGAYSTLNASQIKLAYSAGYAAGLAVPRSIPVPSQKQIANLCTKWWFTEPPHLKGKYASPAHK
jgi:hypothetical protein